MFSFDNDLLTKCVKLVSATCFIYIVHHLLLWIKNVRQLPSGPWGIPIFGYLPFLKQPVYLAFDELAKTHGSVYCVKLGKHNVVVVTDWDHMKEGFANECLLGRPHETFFPGLTNVRSFVEMSGQSWREQRNTALSIFRTVGFGKSLMEELIKQEIDQLMNFIEQESAEPIDLEATIMPSVSNNICILLFGHTFDYKDPNKMKLDENYHMIVKNFAFAGVTAFLPWLANILITLGIFDTAYVAKGVRWTYNYFQTEIDAHEKKFDENVIVDYLDGYLLERKKRKDKGLDPEKGNFSLEILRRNVTDFFGAGTETVTSTLVWAMLYLVAYPEIQEKIRKEIQEVIGHERKPLYADRNEMPYTMAFIYETHRVSSVIAANLLRRATVDTKIGNYNVPKETVVIFNIWSIHYDPKLWVNPTEFNPDRFLSTESGVTKAIKPAYLVPFSGGKRACPGEGLANVELFLYLTCILQRFKISTKPGVKISFDSHFGLSRRPAEMPLLKFEKIQS
ncbi:cytochrome P450 2C15 [Tetranychus urticae]|uniref:Cytochrome P450 n=1 Tax=Tetranychus urticae TaxID=32264 RepID=T1KGE6_TETUR|nr:cytochrome P450 2C15 [Tetranychus urticae]